MPKAAADGTSTGSRPASGQAAEGTYEASAAWDAERPDTLVICCSDGRWRASTQEFVQHHLSGEGHADLVMVPGGIEPLTLLDLLPKDFSFLRRRLEALVETHGTRRIVAIAHEDCGWYRHRRVGPVAVDLRERQVTDLKRAGARLRSMFPGVQVETWYARLSDATTPRVVFEKV